LIGDGLDGDGMFPVKWDFRKHSLLLAAARNAANAGQRIVAGEPQDTCFD
jgi:hypothetical protein